jgi:hypothetical protein
MPGVEVLGGACVAVVRAVTAPAVWLRELVGDAPARPTPSSGAETDARLEARVERLERRVAKQRRQIERLQRALDPRARRKS